MSSPGAFELRCLDWLTWVNSEAEVNKMLSVIEAVVYIGLMLLLAGCFSDPLVKSNQQQLQRQQAELEQLRAEMARLEAQGPTDKYPTQPPGSCDSNIMGDATRKGGERFAVGDFASALSYYQDALTACPQNAQANLNLARTYEALGDRAQAVAHYRTAANASGSDANGEAVHDARAALARLGG
jgi:tetratricopeptide (TPR) repeat protein